MKTSEGLCFDRETIKIAQSIASNDNLRSLGRFVALRWKNDKAQQEAQKYLAKAKKSERILGDDEWNKYYSYCEDIQVQPNIAITAGLTPFLQQAVGLNPATIFGGPASTSPSQNKTFLGIGSVVQDTTINSAGGYAAGATTITVASTSNFGANYLAYFTDSTTVDVLGTNPEKRLLTAATGTTLFLSQPLQYTHANSTYVYPLGVATATDMPGGGSNVYKGIDTAFPTVSTISNLVSLTWQCTFASAEANFAWRQSLIGYTTGSVPSAGAGNSGVTSIPGSSTLLAATQWVPFSITKNIGSLGLQYVMALS